MGLVGCRFPLILALARSWHTLTTSWDSVGGWTFLFNLGLVMRRFAPSSTRLRWIPSEITGSAVARTNSRRVMGLLDALLLVLGLAKQPEER